MPHGLPRGHKKSEETKQKMREGALRRSSRIIGRYGYTAEVVNAAIAEGKEWCSTCKKFCPSEEFGNQATRTRCLPCGKVLSRKHYLENTEYHKRKSVEYRAENPEIAHAWERKSTLKKYGVDESWYERTLAAQGGHCRLCPATQSMGRRYLFIDHSHNTGKVRGILCAMCNFHLHSMEKDGWSELAMAYLREFEDDIPCLASAELPNITP